MKRWISTLGTGILILSVWLAACAPAAAPAPALAPAAPLSKAAALPSGEDATWAQVVEAAKKEGEVNLYSFNYVGDVGLAMSRAFQKRYGIKMNIITGRGAEFIERLKTETRLGQVVADFSEGSTTHMFNMKVAGVTKSVLDLPALREKDAWEVDPLAMDAEGHIIGQYQTVYSPWVNTNLVKPGQEPQSFQDLLKPEWKGKILAHDPRVSSAAYNYLVPLVNAKALDWDYVQALGGQDLLMTPGTVQSAEMVARGESPLALMNSASTAIRFVVQGAPLKAISYKEGNVTILVSMVAIKNGPHPNAGRVLINWLLSEEGQNVQGKAMSVPMVRKGLPDFMPAAAKAPATRLIVTTPKDLDEQARLMREGFLTKLWKK